MQQDDTAILAELGIRARAWRARRSMTQKALVADSGLSERFLADVEGGKGNVSINSMEAAAIVRALNDALIDLRQDSPRPAVAVAQALLARLDDSQLESTRIRSSTNTSSYDVKL